MDILEELSASLEAGDTAAVTRLTTEAVAQGLAPEIITGHGLVAGMNVVGQKFKAHEIFLPDVLLAARAMHAAMEILKPHLVGKQLPTAGKVVIGTVQGDLHDIGKNLVSIMLRGAGFEVIDLGKDVAPERFVDEAEKTGADAIGMSALLTTTMPMMKEVVALAKKRGLYGKTRILVGGAPLTAEYAEEIGADAYCFDGTSAVDRMREFAGG
ncbi:MAG: corrinoid protein [Candidatus Zixiibacteriota bacterium]|nr:MAG: corrinoid protein [candidate division Zixibacteria bacterium]